MGLCRAGSKVIAAVDNDALSVRTYRQIHKSTCVVERNIKSIDVDRLTTDRAPSASELDLLAGTSYTCKHGTKWQNLLHEFGHEKSHSSFSCHCLVYPRCIAALKCPHKLRRELMNIQSFRGSMCMLPSDLMVFEKHVYIFGKDFSHSSPMRDYGEE